MGDLSWIVEKGTESRLLILFVKVDYSGLAPFAEKKS